MRLALVSTGLGRILRGFEAFTESLFLALQQHSPSIDATLFQGGGRSSEKRLVIPNLHREDVPGLWLSGYSAGLLEARSFALALYPRLLAGRFDVVHYNELVMGSALFHLRRMFGGRFKLLYCNGAPSPPIHYHQRCDFAQMITGPAYEEALAFGLPSERLFAIPYGLDSVKFSPESRRHRAEIRNVLKIPDSVHVVLSVAAIKRDHKRIDYLIEEVAQQSGDLWLVVAGQRTAETRSLEAMAESMIPGRWRFVSWPHEDLPKLYGAADTFVLCSLTEAFGLVTVEAMLSELSVIIHDGPVFRWLAQGTTTRCIDMSRPGMLRSALSDIGISSSTQHGRETLLRIDRDRAIERFSWSTLVPQYLSMYGEVVRASMS